MERNIQPWHMGLAITFFLILCFGLWYKNFAIPPQAWPDHTPEGDLAATRTLGHDEIMGRERLKKHGAKLKPLPEEQTNKTAN